MFFPTACWMWDYLRRSGQGGFFLPLSGGADSSSTAVLVFSMCHLLVKAIQNGDEKSLQVINLVTIEPKGSRLNVRATLFVPA